MEVIARQLTAVSAHVTRLVNMEAMFARQLSEGCMDSDTTALRLECDFALDGAFIKDCDRHLLMFAVLGDPEGPRRDPEIPPSRPASY
jgi:hypothetical protein